MAIGLTPANKYMNLSQKKKAPGMALLPINCSYGMRRFIVYAIMLHDSVAIMIGLFLTVYSVLTCVWMTYYGQIDPLAQTIIPIIAVGFGVFLVIAHALSFWVSTE